MSGHDQHDFCSEVVRKHNEYRKIHGNVSGSTAVSLACCMCFKDSAGPVLCAGLYLSDFHWGGSEFRLATSDYSGHGGCQIGTVE